MPFKGSLPVSDVIRDWMTHGSPAMQFGQIFEADAAEALAADPKKDAPRKTAAKPTNTTSLR
jgi:hypothetical protein